MTPTNETPARPASVGQAQSRRRRKPPGPRLLLTLGLVLMLPALAATILRVFPPSDAPGALVASFIPYGLICWVPATLVFGIAAVKAAYGKTRLRSLTTGLALVSLAGLVTSLVWELPAFVPDQHAAAGPGLTVASLNVAGKAGQNSAAQATLGADVVVFVEASPEWVAGLPTRFREEFPYAAGAPLQHDTGSIIFSRYPITDSQALPTSSFPQWSATINSSALGSVQVVGVHPCNPFCGPGLWTVEHTELEHWLARHSATPTIVAGDFNAVDDHGPMQQLAAAGWRSAADLAGAGFVRTYPANRKIPPLIAIDHVLVNADLTATSFETFEVPGTDHRGIITTISRG